MPIMKLWDAALENARADQGAFWKDYYEQEKGAYRIILAARRDEWTGTAKELAGELSLPLPLFAGFLDGIRTSLNGEPDFSEAEEDSVISLSIDWERLYTNMHQAKADWLYNLDEWDGVLSGERRKELVKAWRVSKIAVAEHTPGRNDPCPCGSGKKYKKCCGA